MLHLLFENRSTIVLNDYARHPTTQSIPFRLIVTQGLFLVFCIPPESVIIMQDACWSDKTSKNLWFNQLIFEESFSKSENSSNFNLVLGVMKNYFDFLDT